MLSLRRVALCLLAGAGLAPSVLADDAETPTKTQLAGSIEAIITPQPAQSSMVPNCNAFYQVRPQDTCYGVARAKGISVAQFEKWNRGTGRDCSSLQAYAWACVGVGPLDPVQTPARTQKDMVAGCRQFHHVRLNENCSDITRSWGASLDDLVRWNPAIGRDCLGMWTGYWLCVVGPAAT